MTAEREQLLASLAEAQQSSQTATKQLTVVREESSAQIGDLLKKVDDKTKAGMCVGIRTVVLAQFTVLTRCWMHIFHSVLMSTFTLCMPLQWSNCPCLWKMRENNLKLSERRMPTTLGTFKNNCNSAKGKLHVCTTL